MVPLNFYDDDCYAKDAVGQGGAHAEVGLCPPQAALAALLPS
jgi:hypothetical protein